MSQTSLTPREKLSNLRRELGRYSLWAFHHVYMFREGEHVSGGDYMYNLASWLDRALTPGGRLYGAIPREHAKTDLGTTSNGTRCACYALKRNIGIIAANIQEGQSKLRAIVGELENNWRIKQDFGASVAPLMDRRGRESKYGDSEIQLANNVRIFTMGIFGKLRGQNVFRTRVDLLIFDDPEDDKSVENVEQRDKLNNWVRKAAQNSMNLNGSIIWLGTILHDDSNLSRYIRDLDCPRRNIMKFKLPAWDVDETPLWPQYWPHERLVEKKREVGGTVFAQEYLNTPIDPDSQAFKPEWWRYFERTDIQWDCGVLYAPDPNNPDRRLPLSCFMAVDPAISQSKDADMFALMVMGKQAHTGHMYILDMVEGHLTFDEQVELIKAKAAHWRVLLARIESQAFQAALAQKVWTVGVPVEPVRHHINKEARIRAAAIHVEHGNVLLAQGEMMTKRFVQQAETFPRGVRDDLLDTFCMNAEKCSSGIGQVTQLSDRKRVWYEATYGMCEDEREDFLRPPMD